MSAGPVLTCVAYREYNGDVRQRCNVSSMRRLDYTAESGYMLEQIARMTASAA